MSLLEEGQKLLDTYTVERFLGQGAFAEVYRVRHRFLGRQAMKVFKTPCASIGDVEHALAEAVLLSGIGHPNVIRVFDANVFETPSGRFGFFTMEYVAGGSLDRLWRSYREKLMPVSLAVEIIRQVCAGLSVAHSENPPIVHRDIKPQNILIGYDAAGLRVRVSDFGLAKRANPLTLLVSARGTLSFKPPEAFENHDSPAADVWAIGTTLYLLLTDTLPFPELDGRDLADAKRFLRPLRPASVYNIAVDPSLDSILSRCLAVEPAHRYHDALELLNELKRWRPRQPELAATTTTSRRVAEAAPTYVRDEGESPMHSTAVEELVREALRKAREPRNLTVAADMLEQALIRAPQLREKYLPILKLWRRGVSM